MKKKHKGSGTEEDKSLIKSNDNKKDCMSALPNEILTNIISLLTIRDAARLSLASRRSRYLCTSINKLAFKWKNIFARLENSNTEVCLCQSNKEKFVKIVDQYLKLYVGQKVVQFTVCFCLGRDHTCYLDQWISFAARMGVEWLMLRLSCNKTLISGKSIHIPDLYVFPHHLLTRGEVSKLKYLTLQSVVLGPNLIDQFSNLEQLFLIGVPLSHRDVQTIFRSSFKLECLILKACSFHDDKLCIDASLRSLKYVILLCCVGVKEIELSSNSLTNLEYIGWEVKLSFLEVPKLERMHIGLSRECGYEYIVSQIGRDVPRINTLSILTGTFQLQSFPRASTVFNKIERLALECYLQSEFDTEKMIAIVRTCPLLKKLCIANRCLPPAHDKQRSVYDYEPAKEIHQHLKGVEIGGFRGTWNHIGFAIYLLKHALALEWMIIKPQTKFYRGTGRWADGERASWDEGERERICEQLE